MAVYGPFQKISDSQFLYRKRIWYTQSKPRKLRLSYDFEERRLVSISGPAKQPWRGYEVAGYIPTNAGLRAYSQAYSRFAKQCQDKAELAVSLAEKKRSVEMIYKRVNQLIAFTSAIKRGRFGDAASELGISLTPKPTKAQERLWSRRQDKLFKWQQHPLRYPPKNELPKPSKARTAGDNWLEFYFGWKPLVKDIYQACVNLTDGIPPFTVKGRGMDMDLGGASGPGYTERCNVRWKCQIIADISVPNPNAHLIAQLGFTNPMTVVWEVIPWSFLLDWVSNAGQICSAFIGFPGLAISNGAVTHFAEFDTVLKIQSFPWDFTASGKAVYMTRRPSGDTIPAPRFAWKPLQFPPGRGAAAIALLLQQMKSLDPPTRPKVVRLKPGYYHGRS